MDKMHVWPEETHSKYVRNEDKPNCTQGIVKNKKANFALEQAIEGQRGNRNIELLFL